MRNRYLLTLAALLLAAVFATFAAAGQVPTTYTVNIDSITCTQIVISYELNSESSGGADFAQIRVLVDGDEVFFSFEDYGPYSDSLSVPLNLTGVGPYLVSVTVSIPQYATGTAGAELVCGEAPADIEFGRVCFGPGAVPATVFFYPNRIEIYAIDSNDAGELVMSFTQEYLKSLPARPSGDAFLIGDSDVHIPIEFYRNSNGFYRVVAGPDSEGKTFECTFGGACSFERSWIGESNRPTDEIVPLCSEPVVQPQPTQSPTVTPSPVFTEEPVSIPST